MIKNIFLTGESGCGKSTLINRILDNTDIRYSGYRTLSYYINGFNRGYYLHGYVDVIGNYSPISIKTGNKSCYGILETFEVLGTEILKKSRECENSRIILLDEIGTLESGAELFKKEIIRTLDCEKLVLGVIKKRENEFLNEIRARQDTLVINIDNMKKEELDNLFHNVISLIN